MLQNKIKCLYTLFFTKSQGKNFSGRNKNRNMEKLTFTANEKHDWKL